MIREWHDIQFLLIWSTAVLVFRNGKTSHGRWFYVFKLEELVWVTNKAEHVIYTASYAFSLIKLDVTTLETSSVPR